MSRRSGEYLMARRPLLLGRVHGPIAITVDQDIIVLLYLCPCCDYGAKVISAW